MNMDFDKVTVVDNAQAQQYEARVNGDVALIAYMRQGDTIIFTHTEVPIELEGHGLANKMAKTVLEQAREQHLSVIPLCPFVASYIRRHPEYRELVHPDYRDSVQ